MIALCGDVATPNIFLYMNIRVGTGRWYVYMTGLVLTTFTPCFQNPFGLVNLLD